MKYRLKTSPVNVWQVGDTMPDWIKDLKQKGDITIGSSFCVVRTAVGMHYAYHGTYVVQDGAGHLMVLNQNVFLANYEEVEDE